MRLANSGGKVMRDCATALGRSRPGLDVRFEAVKLARMRQVRHTNCSDSLLCDPLGASSNRDVQKLGVHPSLISNGD